MVWALMLLSVLHPPVSFGELSSITAVGSLMSCWQSGLKSLASDLSTYKKFWKSAGFLIAGTFWPLLYVPIWLDTSSKQRIKGKEVYMVSVLASQVVVSNNVALSSFSTK